MQFINKFKYKRKGHRIIKAFIKDKWNNDIQRYVNLNYNELKRIKAFKYLSVVIYCSKNNKDFVVIA